MASNPIKNYPSEIHQYQITQELGHGAFSVVCKALNTQNHQNYAVKIFPKSNLSDEGDCARFQREINAMAFLRHENLVALYDFFWDDLNYYMVIDLCSGGELFDYIVDHDKLDEPTAALIFKQIANALSYCHSLGVAHRDLKPENVLLDNFPRIKVSDFGLCGYISDQKMMKTFCGSPCYCSPECLCRVQYDGRLSDVWSLGVILYAMVTGEHPWNISNTSIMLRQILKGAYTVPPFVSAQCKDLICKMMQVNPRDRISLQDILKHPWLKAADKSKAKMPPPALQNLSSLPPLTGLTLEEISEASAQSSQRSDHGIFSPFEANDNVDEQKSSLPKLCIRSSSLQNVRNAKATLDVEEITQNAGRRKFVNTSSNLSMANNRQRSAANLLLSKPHTKPGVQMMTIKEDDN